MVVLNAKQQELLGEWKLESSENFDEYMKVCLIRVHKSLDRQFVKVRKLSHLFFTQRKASMSTFEANIVARKPFFLCLIQLYLF
jgi:hypothetical protein